MLGCNESNIIFQQHLCKLWQLRRSNGRNSQAGETITSQRLCRSDTKSRIKFPVLYAATFSVCAITLVVVCPVMETVVRRWYIQVLTYVPDTLIVFTELQSENIQKTSIPVVTVHPVHPYLYVGSFLWSHMHSHTMREMLKFEVLNKKR